MSHVCASPCLSLQIELLASNATVMGAQFANRGNQIVSSRMLTLPEFKQQTSVRGPTLKVTRGSYKVLAQQALWNWLQVRKPWFSY